MVIFSVFSVWAALLKNKNRDFFTGVLSRSNVTRAFDKICAVGALLTMHVISPVFAASGGGSIVLDTQKGIHDGASGLVLQTAPFSTQPIVWAQPIATPAQLEPNSSQPFVVAPYIVLPINRIPVPMSMPQGAPASE